jgi:hypothetical protein
MRKEARRALQIKRRIWRGDDAATAELEVAAAAGTEWALRFIDPGMRGRLTDAPRRRHTPVAQYPDGPAGR